MLMPLLSVTAIGLAAAVLAIGRRRPPGAALLRGLLGAWAGFLAGAVAGLMIDVATGGGAFVALVGHAGAIAGAAVLALRAAGRAPAGRPRR